MNKEIEIPEGYEARIEGNKVILEPKESDNERIRKELLEEVGFIIPHKYETDSKGLVLSSYHARINKYRAYLERQKKQKPADLSELMVHKEPYIAPVPIPIVADEQKPVDKLTLKNPMTGEKVYEREIPDFMKGADPKDTEAIVHLTSKGWTVIAPGIQEPSEWSEEDEKFFKAAILNISYSVSDGKSTDCRCVTTEWLKGIRERLKSIRPQSKSGWRHYMWNINMRFDYSALVQYDDNQNYEIVFAGNRPKREVCGNYIFLKDICSQPHWKPSEEQINSLWTYLHVTFPNKNVMKIVESLYYDLKNLLS